jgi:hypothetical protein
MTLCTEGFSRRHVCHDVAQNHSTTTLPWSVEESNVSPVMPGNVNMGMGAGGFTSTSPFGGWSGSPVALPRVDPSRRTMTAIKHTHTSG